MDRSGAHRRGKHDAMPARHCGVVGAGHSRMPLRGIRATLCGEPVVIWDILAWFAHAMRSYNRFV